MTYVVEVASTGERVEIVEKKVLAGNAPDASTVLISQDGRTFRTVRPGMKVEETTEVGYDDTPAEPVTGDELSDEEKEAFAAEAAAANGTTVEEELAAPSEELQTETAEFNTGGSNDNGSEEPTAE